MIVRKVVTMSDFLKVEGKDYRVVRVAALDTLSVRINGKQFQVVGSIGSREFVLANKDTEHAAKLFINKITKGVDNGSTNA